MEIAEFAIKMFLASPVTHLASQDEGEKGLFQPQQPRGKPLGGAAPGMFVNAIRETLAESG